MANANTINFQPEVKAKDELKALAKAAQTTEVAPAVDPELPKPGDKFTPDRGKTGVYHALQGSPALVRIVTH